MQEYRILHIEDTPTDVDLIKRLLKKGSVNFQYYTTDSEEGFRRGIEEFNPDIILCDHSLPTFDSTKAFEIYNEHKLEIPFILVTGNVSEEYAIEMMRMGIDDYLLKANPERLSQAIRKAYSKRKDHKALLEADRNFRMFTNDSLLPIYFFNADTKKLIYANPSFLQLLGYSEEELSSLTIFSFVQRTEEDLDRIFKKVLQEKQVSVGEGEWKCKDGKLVNVIINVSATNRNGNNIFYVTGLDITERKKEHNKLIKAENQIRNFAEQLNNSIEAERSNIAREIHDELGQQITVLKMDISWILHKQNNIEEWIIAKLQNILEISEGLINTLRRISSDLRPPIIDEMGLVAALEWKCNDFEEKTGIACDFVSAIKERKFETHFSINTFRILQETLTNVSRHAEAKSVIVSVSENETCFFLEIADDGKGINIDNVQKTKTLGMLGMKERAASLGGKLIIEGTKNKGTRTQLIIPLKNEYFNS